MSQPIEQLEQRTMLSSVSLDAYGTLNVVGSDLADTMVLERTNNVLTGGDRIAVMIRNSGETIVKRFSTAQVKQTGQPHVVSLRQHGHQVVPV